MMITQYIVQELTEDSVNEDFIQGMINDDPLSLSNHITTVHEGKRRYSCHICGNGFHFVGQLNDHVAKVHEEKKDWACLICGQSYSDQDSLQQHILGVHETRENSQLPSTLYDDPLSICEVMKEFPCDKCNASFSRKFESHGRVEVLFL